MKIAWITNYQAPYREPMWRELATIADLDVVFLFHQENVRHWTWRKAIGYRSSVLRTRQIPLPRAVARRLGEPMVILEPGAAGRLLRGADALVVHEWWQLAYVWCALRARTIGIPYLIYSESTLQSRQFRSGPAAWFRSLFFRQAGAVIVPGPAAAGAAMSNGTAPHRIVESVNSVDLDLFGRKVAALRVGETPCAAGHRFVYVGQLIQRKNVHSLIRAFTAADKSSSLDIAGDGAELEALKSLAVEYGVASRVRFHGFLPEAEVLQLLAKSHTLVLPSTEEVYGFTALEAYVAGLQVVVSERAGVAPNLAGRRGTWIVDPTEDGLHAALREAESRWAGWRDRVDTELASPRRAASDIVLAAQIAREPWIRAPSTHRRPRGIH